MKNVAFVLPLLRFSESDAVATRAALCKALGISDGTIDHFVRDAVEHSQLVVNFRVTPEQFSTFLILRNDSGGKNWFADMKPRIIDRDGEVVNKRIVDFTLPSVIRGQKDYSLHDYMPQHFVDRQNERHAARPSAFDFGAARYAGNWGWKSHLKRYDVEVNPHPRGDYDIAFGSDGRLKWTKWPLQVLQWDSGSIAINFKKPPVENSGEFGTLVHQTVESLTADIRAKNVALETLLSRALSVIAHGIRVVKKLRGSAELRGKVFASHGQSAMFINHGETVLSDAKALASDNGDAL